MPFQPLLSVHFADDATLLCRVVGGKTVDVLPQTLLADCANLNDGNLGVLALRTTPAGAAPPARMQSEGEGADNHGFEVSFHLIATDDHHWLGPANFSTYDGTQTGNVHGIPPRKGAINPRHRLWQRRSRSSPPTLRP